MGIVPTICPKCTEKNNPEFTECWKCHHSFLPRSQQISILAGKVLKSQILFWRRFFSCLGILLLVGLGLFCWGLVSNVVLGKMTTGQYVHKISLGIRQMGMDLQQKHQKIMSEWPGPILETLDRVTQVKGVPNGPSRKYFKDGHLESEVTYMNGKREGPAKLYYESGHLKTEGFFRDGNLEGPVKEYDEKGNLKPSEK